MNKKIYVDKSKCVRCGTCGWICSGFVMLRVEDGTPVLSPEADDYCFHCGQCVSVCPTGALSSSDIDIKDCKAIVDDLKITAEQALQFVRSRRSIRNFTKEKIDQKTMYELIRNASYAPTGGNFQGVKWIVIDDREKIKQISDMTKGFLEEMVKLPGNEVLLPANSIGSPDDYVFWDAPAVVIAYCDNPIDYGIALTYLDLCAHGMGLGVCWAGYFNFALRADHPGLKEAAGIPVDCENYYPVMVGHPDERVKYYRMPPRKEPEIRFM